MWTQGQHVTVVGKTGSGKTSFLHSLLKLRSHVIMLATKDDDLPKIGWRVIGRADQIDPTRGRYWRLQPAYSKQEVEFRKAIALVRNDGAWCIDFDELYRMLALGLRDEIVQLLTQGRSERISVVCGVQRPASRDIPREAWSEATHIFSFRLTDGRDRDILRQQVNRAYADKVGRLPAFHFQYYNTMTDETKEGAEHELLDVLEYPKEKEAS